MNREDPGDTQLSAEEREFAAYLQQRSLAEHGHEDAAPSAALDAQVLRAAHQAVAPSARHRAPLTRWALPGSLAATVLVSLAFILHSGMQTPTRPPISSTASSQAESLRETATADRAASAPSRAQRTEQGTAAVQAPAAALNAAPAAAETRVQPAAQAESDPQAWLARIEALRAQGKQQQADAQLRRLRAAFPDYPITAAQSAAADAKRAAPPADRTPK